jgi:nucleoside phosphorylase
VFKKQKGNKKRNTRRSDSTSLIDFAFITAIEVERVAVCNAFKLTPRHRERKGVRVYWRGRLPLKGGEYYEIVVAQSPEMAQVEAALLTSDTIHDWAPAALLLVGVAGAASDGSKEDDEALGDVILGKDVYYYERGKVVPDGIKAEPIMFRSDATLWNSVITLPLMRTRVPVVRPDRKWLALVKHYSAELDQEHYPEDRAAGVIAMLLEGALGMAIELNDPRATSRAWGGLLLRMLNVAPELASHMGHLVLKRVFELPAAQLHGIYPVLLAIRALNREPL